MDIIASPTTVTFNTQFGAPPAGGSPVEVVEAKVLQILAEGRARLAIATTIVDVVSSVPLTVGSTVHLSVKHTPEGVRLTLLDPAHTTGAKSAVPLIVEGSSRPALEAAFPAAATFHAPAGTAAADASHGSVHAGHVAVTPAMPSVASPPLSPAATSAAALAQAVRGAAVRQSGLAPLFADLAVALGSPTLPAPVRAAVADVLALRVPVAAGLPATVLKEAFRSSGLFLEANLAVGDAVVRPSNDLKAALLSLRQVLRAFVAAEAGVVLPRELAVPSPLTSPATVPPPATLATPAAPAMSSVYAAAAPVPPPNIPPPYRGAPTVAQPEAMPQITEDTTAGDTARALLRDTEGSLSRQTLMQAASLPEPTRHADSANGPRWHFEIPFATPQGTTLAQFEISRDGHGPAPTEGHKSIWRARFSVDVEPLGAVHAQVALIGERAAVTLWAERPDAAARIRDGAADLKAALSDAAFEPDILVRDGAPPRPREVTAPTGHFLDRAT